MVAARRGTNVLAPPGKRGVCGGCHVGRGCQLGEQDEGDMTPRVMDCDGLERSRPLPRRDTYTCWPANVISHT